MAVVSASSTVAFWRTSLVTSTLTQRPVALTAVPVAEDEPGRRVQDTDFSDHARPFVARAVSPL